MCKNISWSLLTLIFIAAGFGSLQAHPRLDSLLNSLKTQKADTGRALTLTELADYYSFIRADSTIYYARRAIDLSDSLHFPYGIFWGNRAILFVYNSVGDYPKAMEWAIKELHLAEKVANRPELIMAAQHLMGLVNFEMEYYDEATHWFHSAMEVQQENNIQRDDSFGPYTQIAVLFLKLNQLDSALFYAKKGIDASRTSTTRNRYFLALDVMGNVYAAVGNYDLAEQFYEAALLECDKANNLYIKARIFRDMARLFGKTDHPELFLYYTNASLEICKEYNFGNYALDVSNMLIDFYRRAREPDSALKYMQVMLTAKDSIFNQARAQQLMLLGFDEKQRQQAIENAKKNYQERMRFYGLLLILGVLLLLAAILYRNNLQRRKTNELLKSQKNDLENTLSELKSTQKQLIQSEKMASLGELTAGIAHEIQNPLNFVNNFSEVNEELILELKEAMQRGNIMEAAQLANDIQQNENKINHHGKRADAIVKNMLEHSRSSSAQKEPTDINAIADEYLRMAYHGYRAKDKAFNISIHTVFDDRIEKVNVIGQDIGRVLLNLYNNAFYSVSEKKKYLESAVVGADDASLFEPSIWVTTAKTGDRIEIIIRDNGIGIPHQIMDKIIQPFFTTRPAGEGTGLGLSLSYDIIKCHDGALKIDSEEGSYAEFVIQLPAN
jgi:two-component system NtrC family sensor kinase